MTETQNYALELKGISKSFPGVRALDNVSLKIRRGTVHALMGENGAGKSTLMKCAFGIYKPDEGEILIDGRPAHIASSRDALASGISMIHQELHPVLHRNVMENLWMGRIPVRRFGPLQLVDNAKMISDTRTLFRKIGIEIEPKRLVREFSASEIQQIEIVRSISYGAKVIIMDEPTSSLTVEESSRLFEIIAGLVETGTSIIYISHKIEEILQISDEVTIMRDGRVVGSWNAEDLSSDLIISRMVGRDMVSRFPKRKNSIGEILLDVRRLTSDDPGSFKDVSFTLHRGEILGVGGLVGSQRTELMESVFGIRAIREGEIYVSGKRVRIASARDAIKNGMALLTEERRSTGIIPVLSVLENMVAANQKKYENGMGVLREKLRRKDVDSFVSSLRIKTPSIKTWIQHLSGGNQQKVLFARWLLTEPDILILDEPTRGIDVGAKYEIYCIIASLAEQGKGIIMISSEMPELLGMSDRVMVMCEGRLSGIVDGKNASDKDIMRLASAYEEKGAVNEH